MEIRLSEPVDYKPSFIPQITQILSKPCFTLEDLQFLSRVNKDVKFYLSGVIGNLYGRLVKQGLEEQRDPEVWDDLILLDKPEFFQALETSRAKEFCECTLSLMTPNPEMVQKALSFLAQPLTTPCHQDL